ERHAADDPDNAIIDLVMFNWVEFAYPVAGNLAVSAAPLQAAAATDAPLSIELAAPAGAAGAGYAGGGARHPGVAAGNGRLRFGGLTRGIDVFPVVADDLRKPARVRAVAEADLRHPGAGYDYLIVSHRSLIDAVAPLAEFHRRNGLKVALLDV